MQGTVPVGPLIFDIQMKTKHKYIGMIILNITLTVNLEVLGANKFYFHTLWTGWLVSE